MQPLTRSFYGSFMKKNFIRGTAIAAAAFIVASGFAQSKAQGRTRYISPNNDGTQDELVIPFRIKDKSRISGWSLVIEDAKGNVVRTIGNKVALPTKITAKSVIKQIGKKRESVEIPPTVSWNGATNSGETAPDGEYFYYITAIDEKGNATSTAKMPVVVDNTRPQITLSVPAEGSRIFGEGDKIVFPIRQEGSSEDLWTATITDSKGNVVKNYKWENGKPSIVEWNGTDDKGVIVVDGVYKYTITATDRAGNTAPHTEVTNIIFSAEKPETNIAIVGTKYFSSSSKSKKVNVELEVNIPEPRAGSGNKLVDWKVEIFDSKNNLVRVYDSNTDGKTPKKKIIFNGKKSDGSVLPDGIYSARVSAEYLNGYKTPEVSSPDFMLDSVPPSAELSLSDVIFSPDGDGNKDTISIGQLIKTDSGSPVRAWSGKIVKEDSDEPVVQYTFGEKPPKNIVWNGIMKDGKIATDGKYYFVLSAEDEAGNAVEVKSPNPFEIDTRKTEIMLAVSGDAFSPTANSKIPYVKFLPVLVNDPEVTEYTLEILDKDKKPVRSVKGQGKIPAEFVWDGKNQSGALSPDGFYTAVISTKSINGNEAKALSQPVLLDTTVPSVSISAPYLVFSPEGDSRKDTVKFNSSASTREELWTASIINDKKQAVRTFTWQGYVAGDKNSGFEWDGADDSGNRVPDGNYSLVISAVDRASNSFTQTISGIVVDTREAKAYVTAALPGFSPISEAGLTTQKFTVRPSLEDGIESWEFTVIDEKKKPVRHLGGQTSDAAKPLVLQKEFLWDGKNDDGKDCEGNYEGHLTVSYIKGNLVDVTTSPFICSVTPPKLSVNITPEFFSPDNDGTDDDLFIKLSGKTTSKIVSWSFVISNPKESKREDAFWQTKGTDKITEQITWNGLSNTSREGNGYAERVQSAMDYPWKFTVTDSLGMTSVLENVIPVDILVVRDGDALKMAVPSIIFRANNADFKTAEEAKGSSVTKEQAQNNERVLKRVAEVLKKFPDYTVTVVGHANNLSGTEEEETSTANGNIPLVPLSQARSAFVKDKLVSYGIEEKRLSTEGKGGREPVVPRSDRANWWKNRRVEFILHK